MYLGVATDGKNQSHGTQAMQIDENTGDFDASIRWNRN
jgi:hypothetical protein